jgi:hypothetical protein
MEAGDLFQIWQSDSTNNGIASESQKAFSVRIRRFFTHDPNRGRPRYLNVRPRTAQPANRMVVSN